MTPRRTDTVPSHCVPPSAVPGHALGGKAENRLYEPSPDRDDPDPAAARRAIRARAAAIERRELRRAVDRLDARDALTDERRAILSRLAAGIVDGVLAAPETALAAAGEDSDAARTAVDLFDAER